MLPSKLHDAFRRTGRVAIGFQCSEGASDKPTLMSLFHLRCPQANLHALRSTCDELTRGLSAARSGLETEREYQAKLQIERDELAGAVERLSSQMSDLQVSGSVAITTSEVCKVVSAAQPFRRKSLVLLARGTDAAERARLLCDEETPPILRSRRTICRP